jgi:hypothetical protein
MNPLGEPARGQRHDPGAGWLEPRPQHDPSDVRTEHRTRRHVPEPGIFKSPLPTADPVRGIPFGSRAGQAEVPGLGHHQRPEHVHVDVTG